MQIQKARFLQIQKCYPHEIMQYTVQGQSRVKFSFPSKMTLYISWSSCVSSVVQVACGNERAANGGQLRVMNKKSNWEFFSYHMLRGFFFLLKDAIF